MMRYNDFKNDNESFNEPSLTIACRYDLRAELDRQHCYGATDAKFASVKELLEGKNNLHIISGPTNDQQPTFSWSNTTCGNHYKGRYDQIGLVDTWNFSWIDYKLQLVNIQNDDDNKKNDDDNSGSITWIIIVACIAGCLILLIILFIIVRILIKKKSSNDIEFRDGEKDVALTNCK